MSELIERQAAIKAIENLQDCYNGFSDTYDKACIIGVIEEIPTAQVNTPTDTPTDTISRQAAIDCVNRAVTQEAARWAIKELPSAQRTGRWIVNRDSTGCMYGRCTSCGMKQYAGRTKYCPNCGARMEEQE